MKKKSPSPLPDTLFTTRAGDTPHLLWGVSPAVQKTLTKKGLEVITTLYRLATGKEKFSLGDWVDRKFELYDLSRPENTLMYLSLARVLPLIEKPDDRRFYIGNLETMVLESDRFHAASDPLEFLWLATELPATLAYVLPEETKVEYLKARVQKGVEEIFRDMTADGVLCASLMEYSRLILASLVRVRFLFPEIFVGKLAKSFDTLVRSILRWTRPNGSLVFSSEKAKTACWTPELLVAALQLDDDLADKKLGITVLPDLISPKKHSARELPPCCFCSEETTQATFRCGWHGAMATACWYGTGDTDSSVPGPYDFRLELSNHRSTLLSGIWETELRFDGIPLSPESEWMENCWIDSENACFLEMEQTWTEGVRLQRQIFAGKTDAFMILADAVLGPEHSPGSLHYVSRIPVFEKTTLRSHLDSLEINARNAAGPLGMFLPLALPEWRSQLKPGQRLECRNHRLEYAGVSEQGGLYMPLFCDLSPVRYGNALTWRPLTVAERASVVPPWEASGFRVMISEEQWLLYRSLAPTANRSLLGHNLLAETLLGRFSPEGRVEELVTVVPVEE